MSDKFSVPNIFKRLRPVMTSEDIGELMEICSRGIREGFAGRFELAHDGIRWFGPDGKMALQWVTETPKVLGEIAKIRKERIALAAKELLDTKGK